MSSGDVKPVLTHLDRPNSYIGRPFRALISNA